MTARMFMEAEPNEWVEVEAEHDNPDDDFVKIIDPRLITLLDAKKKELRLQ